MYRRRAGQRRRNEIKRQPALHGPFNFNMPNTAHNQQQGATRDQLHHAWNQAAAHGVHWDMGLDGFNGAPLDLPSTSMPDDAWGRPGRQETDGRFRTWDANTGNGDPTALPPLPGMQAQTWPINDYRRQELNLLQQTGDFIIQGGAILPPHLNPDHHIIEPRWKFCGIVDENSNDYAELGTLSTNWSIFKYILSDLTTHGHQFGSDILRTLQEIVCDIISIAGPKINQQSGCMVYFQGEYDHAGDGHQWGGNKPWLFFTDRGFRLGDIMENP